MIELKYVEARSYAAPETAARRVMEIANTIEADQGDVHAGRRGFVCITGVKIMEEDDHVTPKLKVDVKLEFEGPNDAMLSKWAADIAL